MTALKRAASVLLMCSVWQVVDGGATAPTLAAPPRHVVERSSVPLGSWLPAAWTRYKASFMRPEGRIVDTANGDVSHSEGQGYGLLLAALANDRTAFATIWHWTQTELLIRHDGLAAWRWDPRATPHIKDDNNATDGDLLIAWALAEAARRWQEPAYRDAARKLALAIGVHVVRPSAFGPILLPGASGFAWHDRDDGPVVNLSYWVFPAFAALQPIAPEVDWAGLRQSGLALIQKARFGPLRLPTDWVSARGPAPEPARNFDAEFGYNAIRIPLYLAWSDTPARSFMGSMGALWTEDGDLGPFVIDVRLGSEARPLAGQGFKAIAALARCISDGRAVPPAVLTQSDDAYYPATLLLLTTIVLQTRYPQCERDYSPPPLP